MNTDKWAMTGCEGSESSLRSDAATKSRMWPFDPASLPFNHKAHTAVEVSPSDQLFSLAISHLAKHGVIVEEDAISYQMSKAEKAGLRHSGCCGAGPTATCHANAEDSLKNVSVSLGIGLFRFTHKGKEIKALHQHIGDPVGCGCGAQVMSSLVLFSEGTGAVAVQGIREFLSDILAASETTSKNTFQVYRWHIKYAYWQCVGRVIARPVSSVVMPAQTSQMLVDDLSEFLSDETAQFYQDHGIPYKRSYLFYGVPGAGKTSMIQALAGKFGRNLCYLTPTHPELSDDCLKSAIERVPDNAIVVLEDVDALFGKNREKKIHQSPLTFSGLLNALDGVGNHDGLIFVLTTNFKEQLDAALIRDGRVDLRVRFDYCTPEQMERMFDNFFGVPTTLEAGGGDGSSADNKVEVAEADPEIAALEAKLAAMKKAKASTSISGVAAEPEPTGAAFRDALLVALDDRKVTTAQLQSFFVQKRKCTAKEVIADVGAVVAALDERAKEEAEKETGAAEKKGENEAGANIQQDKKSGQGEVVATAAEGGAKTVHVHVHTDPK